MEKPILNTHADIEDDVNDADRLNEVAKAASHREYMMLAEQSWRAELNTEIDPHKFIL